MSSDLVQAINRFLASGAYKEQLSLIKGIRNGIVYGVKIRFPHALVMTFLFKNVPLKEKLKLILRATYQHAKNLAKFVFIYKFITQSWSRLSTSSDSVYDVKKPWHVAIAAFIGGYIVFGENNPINQQINMYLLSRILFGLCRLGSEKGYLPSSDPKKGGRVWFPLFGATVWGVVLWLFEYHRNTLQPSLQSSMTYLYDDSSVWHSLTDFLLYNKMPDF